MRSFDTATQAREFSPRLALLRANAFGTKPSQRHPQHLRKGPQD